MKYIFTSIIILILLISCHHPQRNVEQNRIVNNTVEQTIITPEETNLRQRELFLSNRVYYIHLFSQNGILVFSSTVRGAINRMGRNWDSDIYWYTENGSYVQWNGGYLISTQRLEPDVDPVILTGATNDAGVNSRIIRNR